jgi:hypothetical protein
MGARWTALLGCISVTAACSAGRYVPPMLGDSGSPSQEVSAACPHGNLLAALPALPVLCRPFASPQPTPPTPDPAECQTAQQTTLSSAPDTFAGSDTAKDSVFGGDGDDLISGMGCSDELYGNAGNDQLNGNKGNDLVHGGQGNDLVHGGQGNDQVYGGLGDDQLLGDLDDDDYYFSEGEGVDVIEEVGGYDRIICAPVPGRPAARLVGWQRSGDDLLLLMSGSGSIRVKGYFVDAASSIDAIVGCQ